MIPTGWMETKVSNMRAIAIETDAKISAETEMTCQVLDKKQLLFKRTDPKTNDLIAQNAPLLSAISLYQVSDATRFMCHLFPADLPHKLAKSEQKNGLVFVEPEMFAEIDEPICEIMQSSRAIICHSLNIKELFAKIVAKVKGEDNDDEDEDKEKKDWTDILRCIVFIVSKEDFEDIRSSCLPGAPPMIEESMRINGKDMTEIEYFFACMEKWGGIDISRLWYHLCQLEDKTVNNIKSQFLKCLEEVNEEEKEFDERCKKVEDKPE